MDRIRTMKVREKSATGFHRARFLILGFSTCLALGVHLVIQSQVFGSTNRQIVVDPATGVAIFGFDPVAYFIDGEPRLGSDSYEQRWAGAVWRFVNPGNMRAFKASPQVYSPRYGGYGALSVARGLTTAGKPVFFEIYDGKLYFFYSHASRHIWLDAPKDYIAEAEKNWKRVKGTLAN